MAREMTLVDAGLGNLASVERALIQVGAAVVVTDDPELTQKLKLEALSAPFNLEIADCEYQCSALVNDFRPDFAFVDCSIGKEATRDISFHLAEDPRIPFVRVILAGAEGDFPVECEQGVFARIERPFSIRDISQCVEFISDSRWDAGGKPV